MKRKHVTAAVGIADEECMHPQRGGGGEGAECAYTKRERNDSKEKLYFTLPLMLLSSLTKKPSTPNL